MSTAAAARLSMPWAMRARGSARRITSLARAEGLMLRRSPSALLTTLGAPILLVAAQMQNAAAPGSEVAGGLDRGALVLLSVAAFGLIFGVYSNLVTVLVARREQLVLKKFRTGEVSDLELLIGSAITAVVVVWTQIMLAAIAGSILLGMSWPRNIVIVLAAVLFGTVVFVLLAALIATVTSSVEMAALTATPALLVSMLLSGLMYPIDDLPGAVQSAAQLFPLTPVVELLRLGLAGIPPSGAPVGFAGSFLPAAWPVLILSGWVLGGWWATRRWFRWEPRH